MTSALVSYSCRPCQRPPVTTEFLLNCCVFLYFPLTNLISSLLKNPSPLPLSSELTFCFSLHRGRLLSGPLRSLLASQTGSRRVPRLTSSFRKNLPKQNISRHKRNVYLIGENRVNVWVCEPSLSPAFLWLGRPRYLPATS